MNIIKSLYVVPGANSCSPVFSVYLPLALAPSPSPSPSPSPENHGTRDANVLSLAGTITTEYKPNSSAALSADFRVHRLVITSVHKPTCSTCRVRS